MMRLDHWRRSGWVPVTEIVGDIDRALQAGPIEDISRWAYCTGRSTEKANESAAREAKKLGKNFIRAGAGILALTIAGKRIAFADEGPTLALFAHLDLPEDGLDSVLWNPASLWFSAVRDPNYADKTVRELVGQTIKRVSLVQVRPPLLIQETYPRIAALELAFDKTRLFLGFYLRLWAENTLQILPPEKVERGQIVAINEIPLTKPFYVLDGGVPGHQMVEVWF